MASSPGSFEKVGDIGDIQVTAGQPGCSVLVFETESSYITQNAFDFLKGFFCLDP